MTAYMKYMFQSIIFGIYVYVYFLRVYSKNFPTYPLKQQMQQFMKELSLFGGLRMVNWGMLQEYVGVL